MPPPGGYAMVACAPQLDELHRLRESNAHLLRVGAMREDQLKKYESFEATNVTVRNKLSETVLEKTRSLEEAARIMTGMREELLTQRNAASQAKDALELLHAELASLRSKAVDVPQLESAKAKALLLVEATAKDVMNMKKELAQEREALALAHKQASMGRAALDQLASDRAALAADRAALSAAEKQLAADRAALGAAEKQLATGRSALGAAEKQLAADCAALGAAEKQLAGDRTALGAAEKELAAGRSALGAAEKELAASRSALGIAEKQLAADRSALGAAEKQQAAEHPALGAAEKKLAADRSELDAAEKQLAANRSELGAAEKQLAADRAMVIAAVEQLAVDRAALNTGLEQLATDRATLLVAEGHLATTDGGVIAAKQPAIERTKSVVQRRKEASTFPASDRPQRRAKTEALLKMAK